MHLYDSINSDKQLFMRILRVFMNFRSHSMTTANSSAKNRNDDIALGAEHIPDLVEFLVPYASLWRSIGTALRFTPQHLNNIQASLHLVSDSPKSYLIKLVEDWILGLSEETPTVTALEKALKSRTVGLGAKAHEVRTHILPSKNLPGKVLPYYRASVNVKEHNGHLHITSSYSKHLGKIEAKENESVLLETEVVSDLTLALEYQWLTNGEPIPESKFHRDTTKPILCISSADIDLDGSVYSCKITVNGKHAHTTKGISLHVPCPLDIYSPGLAAMYYAQPEVPKDTWPPVSNKKHINLALIKQETINYAEYACFTIRGDMDDILQHKQKVEYDDIFRGLKSKHVLFIEGRPGCGKTTFVHKITQDWAVVSSSQGMRLVLLVSLRVLNNLNKPNLDLSDILKLFKDIHVPSKLLEERKGKGICFIFDGFDEFSPSDGKNSIVHKIINKEYLVHSTVIVASRPAALAELRNRADFQNEQILEYFDHYPFSSNSKSRDLKAYLLSHPNILHMCYLPIHTAMVGYLFEVTGKVPNTETEIYTHFTNFTIVRSLSKSRALKDIDIHNLNEEEKKLFNRICKLALEKTIQNKQVLHQDDAKLCFSNKKDADISLGLVTIDCIAGLYGFKDTYTFLHLTFQEYLAAHHISTLGDTEQKMLFQQHGHKNHMLVVWKFYCGLTNFNVRDGKFQSILDKTPGKHLFHIHCAFESQQALPCTLLSSSLVLKNNLNIFDCTAIGYVLNKSDKLQLQLSFTECNFDIEVVQALVLELKEVKQSIESLTWDFNRNEVETCTSYLLKNFQNLRKLSLRSDGPLPIYCEALADALRQCTNLEDLELRLGAINDADAKILASGLTSYLKLKRICIQNNGLSVEGARTMLNSISQCSLQVDADDITVGNKIDRERFVHILGDHTDLQHFQISFPSSELPPLSDNWKHLRELKAYLTVESYIQREGITQGIARSIRDCFHELHTIVLHNFRMDEAAESLAEGFSKCPQLEVLDLSNSRCLATTGIGAIATRLIRCIRLQEFRLNNCGMDCQKAVVLSFSLKHYRSLQILGLHTNNIGQYGAQALANSIKNSHTLESVDLSNNKISKGKEISAIFLL